MYGMTRLSSTFASELLSGFFLEPFRTSSYVYELISQKAFRRSVKLTLSTKDGIKASI